MDTWFEDTLAGARSRFETASAGWADSLARRGARIWCGRGCSNCCNMAVFTTFPEAWQIAREITPEQAAITADRAAGVRTLLPRAKDFKSLLRLQRQDGQPCPFLDAEGACGIYSHRPLPCRALFSTRNPDWCAVDFGDLHPAEKQAFLSSLDPALVAYPTHYLAAPQELARHLEADLLAAMQLRYGFSLAGLLPVMVHLIREFGLDRAVAAGYQPTLDILKKSGLAHPFLFHISE